LWLKTRVLYFDLTFIILVGIHSRNFLTFYVLLATGGRTIWGWSPAKGCFKPKVEDKLSGKMIDPPDTEGFAANFKSKWTQASCYQINIKK